MKKVVALFLTLIMACSLCLTSCDMTGVAHYAKNGNIKKAILYLFEPAGTYESKHLRLRDEEVIKRAEEEKAQREAKLLKEQIVSIRLESGR